MENITCLVPLTQGQNAIVSPEDFEWAMQFEWQAQRNHKSDSLWYARRWFALAGCPKRKSALMHREIAQRAGFPESPRYDHRDHDGLNNTRENLRPCTNSQNVANKPKAAGLTSKYKGVHWCRTKWESGIRVKGKRIYLGFYADEKDAAQAYLLAAHIYFGEFAYFD